jgi:uncharacterized protein
MQPIYPDFKKIELSDYDLIDQFTRQFPPYNDFEFTSLWTYNTIGENTFSFLHNNLIIRIQDFVSGSFFYSFLGNNKINETVTALIVKSKEENLGSKLYLVPEISIKAAVDLSKFFLVKEDPDSFDYILSVDDAATLNGAKYHDKRNLVNKFNKLYSGVEVKALDLTDKETERDMLDLFYLWENQKKKTRNETNIELTAVKNLFSLARINKMTGTGIYISNKLIGFCTYNLVQDNYAILSFEKADYTYQGIFEMINNQAAMRLKTLGYRYINFEQDLGIPGLKKAKQLWRPIYFLKKYTVEPL